MNPKISIIMGIYNCSATLSEAIDSIIAQTYNNWELIMCDDCSTDNTDDVIKPYLEDERIKSVLPYPLNSPIKSNLSLFLLNILLNKLKISNQTLEHFRFE